MKATKKTTTPAADPESPEFAEAQKLAANLLTREQVARLLSCSSSSVDNWVRRGLLTPRRLGPRFCRFDAVEVRNFLAKITA